MKLILSLLLVIQPLIKVVEQHGNKITVTPTSGKHHWEVWVDFDFDLVKDSCEIIGTKTKRGKLFIDTYYGYQTFVEIDGACEFDTWVLSDYCEPVEDLLHVTGERGLYGVMALNGRLLRVGYVPDLFDMSAYPRGVYILEIGDNRYKVTKK